MGSPSGRVIEFREEGIYKSDGNGVTHVCRAALSPDGKLLACGGSDKFVRVYEAPTLRLVFECHPPNADDQTTIVGIAWAPNGTTVIAVSNTGVVLSLSRPSEGDGGWSFHDVANLNRTATDCDYGNNGNVAVSTADHSVQILAPLDGYTVKQSIAGLTSFANRVAFSPDGRSLAVGCGHGFLFVYAQGIDGLWSPIFSRKPHMADITTVTFNSINSHLVAGSRDGTATLWRTPKEGTVWPTSPEHVFKEHKEGVTSTCFIGEGLYVVSAGLDRTVRSWRTADGVTVSKMRADNDILALTLHPQTGLLVAAVQNMRPRVWRQSLRSRAAFGTSKYLSADEKSWLNAKDTLKAPVKVKKLPPGVLRTLTEDVTPFSCHTLARDITGQEAAEMNATDFLALGFDLNSSCRFLLALYMLQLGNVTPDPECLLWWDDSRARAWLRECSKGNSADAPNIYAALLASHSRLSGALLASLTAGYCRSIGFTFSDAAGIMVQIEEARQKDVKERKAPAWTETWSAFSSLGTLTR